MSASRSTAPRSRSTAANAWPTASVAPGDSARGLGHRLNHVYDVLVLGSGIAGLTTALHAAARGMSVLVLTKGELSHSATRYAQGGVAAALEDPDSPDLHLADTLVAGAGLCDVDAVRTLVTEGPARVRELAAMGAHFDSDEGTL